MNARVEAHIQSHRSLRTVSVDTGFWKVVLDPELLQSRPKPRNPEVSKLYGDAICVVKRELIRDPKREAMGLLLAEEVEMWHKSDDEENTKKDQSAKEKFREEQKKKEAAEAAGGEKKEEKPKRYEYAAAFLEDWEDEASLPGFVELCNSGGADSWFKMQGAVNVVARGNDKKPKVIHAPQMGKGKSADAEDEGRFFLHSSEPF